MIEAIRCFVEHNVALSGVSLIGFKYVGHPNRHEAKKQQQKLKPSLKHPQDTMASIEPTN